MLRRVALVRTDVSVERRFLQEPHGVTSQKMEFFKNSLDSGKFYHSVQNSLLCPKSPSYKTRSSIIILIYASHIYVVLPFAFTNKCNKLYCTYVLSFNTTFYIKYRSWSSVHFSPRSINLANKYKNMEAVNYIKPLDLLGCEMRFLILRKECSLKASEIRVLGKISGRKREVVTQSPISFISLTYWST
jgi:hypothetical protein